MAGNISQFRASFKNDLARPSRFTVFIPANFMFKFIPGLNGFLGSNGTSGLTLRCESAEMPGRFINTTDRKIGAVPVWKVPYQSTYNEANMTFIVDDDMNTKLFFDLWQQIINPTSTFNFRYPKDYVTDISVTQYDVHGEVSYKAVMLNAYPISINAMDLDWSSDSYHKLNVTFAYTHWTFGSVNNIVKDGILNLLTNI